MAELTTTERLQPSLLDRLTDEEPGKQSESRERRVMSMQQLRQAVLRDLNWLLNASSRKMGDEISEMPLAASSVLNYGIPDLTGLSQSGIAAEQIERMVTAAIRNFEPRILRAGLAVRMLRGREEHNTLSLRITGELWARPTPEALFLRTEVDLETGRFTVAETGGR